MWYSVNFSDLICQILAKCDGQFCSSAFAVACRVRSPCNGLHHWSDALTSSFTLSENGVVKIWGQYLQYLQSYLEMFIRHYGHLVAAMPLLETDNTSPVSRYIIEIWPVLMICTWKNRDLCFGTKHRCFIWAKRSTAQRAVMVHSARSIALLLAPFDVALPSEREKPS